MPNTPRLELYGNVPSRYNSQRDRVSAAAPGRVTRVSPPGPELWWTAAQSGEDAVLGLTGHCRVNAWSAPARRLFGYQEQEVNGCDVRSLFSKGPGDTLESILARALEGERIERVPVTVRRRDGLLVPAALTLAPLGSSGGLCVIVRDQTEQFLAEKALAETHRRQSEVLELSRIGTWLWDVGSDVVQLSDGLYELYGIEPLQFEGTMAARMRLTHPDDRRRLRRCLDSALRRRSPFELEYRIVRRDGTLRWVHERASLEFDQSGAVAGMSGICQDVTDRREAAEAIRRHASQLDLLQRIAAAANEATSLPDALQRCMSHLCELLRWDLAHAVLFDAAGAMEREIWHSPTAGRFPEFRRYRESVPTVAPPGGQRWELGHYRRSAGRPRMWPRTRFSFPVAVKGATRVVVELYSLAQRDADSTLIQAVEGAAIQIGRVIERERSNEALAHQALHDPLTGLPNRTLFLDRLGQSLRGLGPSRTHLAVMFIDLDNFKLINDSLGHEVGDRVLTAVAHRLLAVMRHGDTAARFGGDEFIILCERLSTDDAVAEIANRLLAAIEEPIVLDGRVNTVVSCSIGIAIAASADARPDHLLRDADAAMYRAKEEGKGRFHVFDPALHERASRKLSIASELRWALGNGELCLEYQPQIRMADGALIGVESLVRWDNPVRGRLAPASWIPVAEETQLIVPIGAWVVREACRAGRRWLSIMGVAPGDFKVCVNVSAVQLGRPELVDSVVAALDESGMDPASLCIEITESVLMSAPVVHLEALLGLKMIGVSIAVDDFGTGYSSLAYLRRFPIDVLKIDKGFVDDLASGEERGTAIVRAIVQLSEALGVTTVAEGVESADQARQLTEAGCFAAQGFYFSRPRSPESITSLVELQGSRLPLLEGEGEGGDR